MSDTSEITNGSLVHYDSSHIQTRRDFMGLCQYNRDEFAGRRKQEPNQECMAKIVRLIETLTDHAKAEWKIKAMAAEEKGLHKPFLPKRFPVALSNEVIVRLLYRTFGESTVRNSLNYLLEIGYIGREQERKNATPLYWLEQKYVQALLKAQAEVTLAGYEFRPPSYQGAISYPGGVISDPSSVNSRPGHSQPGSESTDNNIDKIREKEKDIPEKERERAFTSVHAPLAPVDFLLEEIYEHETQVSRPTADHDPLPGSSTNAHALVGATPDVEDDAHHMPVSTIGATNGHDTQFATSHPPDDTPVSSRHTHPDARTDQAFATHRDITKGVTNGQLNTLTASASIPGEPENSPLSVHSPHSLQGTDGAATGPEGSGPRASGKRKGRKVTQEPEPISQEALRILDEWDVLMKRQCPRTEGEKGTIAAAQALIPSHPSRDDLKAVWQFLFTSNPDWYRAHGVSIQDIEKNFGKWQSLQVKPDAPATNGKPDGPVIKRWSAAEARAYRKVLEAKQGDLQA